VAEAADVPEAADVAVAVAVPESADVPGLATTRLAL
jgi:hypothetical protein